jgi:hypothetical protein
VPLFPTQNGVAPNPMPQGSTRHKASLVVYIFGILCTIFIVHAFFSVKSSNTPLLDVTYFSLTNMRSASAMILGRERLCKGPMAGTRRAAFNCLLARRSVRATIAAGAAPTAYASPRNAPMRSGKYQYGLDGTPYACSTR